MEATISSVRMTGANLLGTSAEQKIISMFFTVSFKASLSFMSHSIGSALAYPPLPTAILAGMPVSMIFAPKLFACSAASGRISAAYTTAPNRLAVATACNPATPVPMTSTLHGLIIPTAQKI